ncbi:MAG: thiol peroxidase [Flavobacteriales bacterium]|nr:thiol peroxidase [Flavobacteriales bacterium]
MVPPRTGSLPEKGRQLPAFRLTATDMTDITPNALAGSRVVFNIFPSIDTSTCAASVRQFNQRAASFPNTRVVCVSKDLPYAHRRFCAAEGIENVLCVSQYKDHSFSDNYGVEIASGRMEGLFARVVIVADTDGTIMHVEECELGNEPDYVAVAAALSR